MARRWLRCDRLPQIYFFWQRNKRTYFSFDSMFFYITAQSRRSCWTRFSISPRAFTFPRPRPDPELKLTLFNLLTLGIPNQAWLCSRLTANFRMTLGGSCYFYTHFGEANSILLSNLKSHRSSFIIHHSSLISHCSSLTTHYSNPHNNVPSAACPAASTQICVVRALLYNVIVALPSWSNITLGFQ